MSQSNKTSKVEVLQGEEALLLDHNYDGIHELDHSLPRWWLWMFYATMVFAAGYAGYYMTGIGPTHRQQMVSSIKDIDSLKPAGGGDVGDGEALLAAFQDPSKVKHGSEVYAAKCLACHGDKGQGLIGPNLTDDFWIHGAGTLKDIATVVTNGVLDKGMLAWGTMLKPDELRDVVAFVHSLHGTNPPQPKAPQGNQQEYKD